MHSQKYLLIIVKIKLICLTLFLEMTVSYFCYIAFLEPPSDQIASQLQKSEFLENLIYQLSGTIKNEMFWHILRSQHAVYIRKQH